MVMAHSPMAALRRSFALLALGALFVAPSFAFAQVYGGSTYGGGNYNVGNLPAAAASSGGGGGVIGGPNGIGYVNTNPTGTSTISVTTTTTISTPSTSISGSSLSEAQIQSILSILTSFGADQSVINSVNASLHNMPAASGSTSTIFTRDLEMGAVGDDVKALQIYLNTHGFIIVESGPGSPGNETTKFGAYTQAALIKFQIANGITPAAGYFGPKTRAVIK